MKLSFKHLLPIEKWPSKKQWAKIFTILTKKEKIFLFVFLFLFLGSSVSLLSLLYFKNTVLAPAVGGSYTEGVVGSPRFINPVYAAGNDVDRALTELIFSGLMKYGTDGKIVPDLAEKVEIKEDNTVYEVYLKENVFWHDRKPLTADDVIFTVKIIQNPDYKSPLRGNYLGIEMEKVSDYRVRFKLQSAYAGFAERLTFKILPEHIWKEISPQNFLLTNYNLRPVGSGPYQFKDLTQNASGSIVSLELVRFKKYHSETNPSQPYLSEITFKFFETEEELAKAARGGRVDGFPLPSPEYWKLARKDNYQELTFSLPRYFAVFFNEDESRFLAEEKIRKALNYATNKSEIIEKVLAGRAKEINSPVLPEVYGFDPPENFYEFDPDMAETLLAEAGLEKKDEQWVKISQDEITEFTSRMEQGSQSSEVRALQTCLANPPAGGPDVYPEGKITGYFGTQTKAAVIRFQEKYANDILAPWGFTQGTGIVSNTTRAKLNEICFKKTQDTVLSFTLVTVADPLLEQVAEKIKEQWEKIGIEVTLQAYPVSQLEQEIIKPRNYEMLLFGEVLSAVPDPFPFWHSSQVKDPGLNLTKYENSAVDNLLEKARATLDEEERREFYQKLQDIVIEQAPAVFLYSPEYIYMTSDRIKGQDTKIIFDPAQRFSNIEEWYVKTKRVWQ